MKKKLTLSAFIILVLALAVFFYIFRSLPDSKSTITTEKIENSSGTMYSISSSSEVRFKIDEQLAGSPFTAVGKTSQISGEVNISQDNGKTAVKIGTIKIDANSFKTDSTKRDAAIRRFILKSTTAGNEYIEFKAISISGLPKNLSATTSFSLIVSGDMTISGITKPETFNAKIDIADKERIQVKVSGTIKRSDFSLVIPNIPFVANVSDEFIVEGDLIAELTK